jgi:hypothetical protein
MYIFIGITVGVGVEPMRLATRTASSDGCHYRHGKQSAKPPKIQYKNANYRGGSNSILCTELYIKEVKHFKNSQQIVYAMDHGNSNADRERNSPRFFQKKPVHIVTLICR